MPIGSTGVGGTSEESLIERDQFPRTYSVQLGAGHEIAQKSTEKANQCGTHLYPFGWQCLHFRYSAGRSEPHLKMLNFVLLVLYKENFDCTKFSGIALVSCGGKVLLKLGRGDTYPLRNFAVSPR